MYKEALTHVLVQFQCYVLLFHTRDTRLVIIQFILDQAGICLPFVCMDTDALAILDSGDRGILIIEKIQNVSMKLKTHYLHKILFIARSLKVLNSFAYLLTNE